MDQPTALLMQCVLHFGEMGPHWGMSRSDGQVVGLLFASGQALCADEIVRQLGLSRSNVGASLSQLETWRLIHQVPRQGDRRRYYALPQTGWEVLRRLAESKRQRELLPTLLFLQGLLRQEGLPDAERAVQERLRALYDLLDLLSSWFGDVQKLSPQTLERLMRMGSRVVRVLDGPARPRQPG